jgi:hypothetical protein
MEHRGEITVSRSRVLALLDAGNGWEAIGRELQISPGLAFMIGTGIPADGSGVPELHDRPSPGEPPSSPQGLVNPREHCPTRNERIETWVAQRAARELKQ